MNSQIYIYKEIKKIDIFANDTVNRKVVLQKADLQQVLHFYFYSFY